MSEDAKIKHLEIEHSKLAGRLLALRNAKSARALAGSLQMIPMNAVVSSTHVPRIKVALDDMAVGELADTLARMVERIIDGE